MKKSVLAIATAAAVASTTILTPVAVAQNRNPSFEVIDQYTRTQDGDRSQQCDAEWFASSTYDPHLIDPTNNGYYYKVKGPHTRDGATGAVNPNSAGVFVIQHYALNSAGQTYVYFRTVVGSVRDVNNAKVTFNLPELPEGKGWEVSDNYPLTDDQRWSYLSGVGYSALDQEPSGEHVDNTVTYDFGTLRAGTGTTLMIKAGPFAPGELEHFTAGNQDFLKVDATLTGDFWMWDAPDCNPAGAYDDSFTTPGQNVIVNLNGEATFPSDTVFATDEKVTDKDGKEVSGWTVTVDSGTGLVIATPPADAPSGVYSVDIMATIPGNGTVTIPARIHVQGEPDISMVVGYQDADGNFVEGVAPEGTVPGHIVTIIKADGTVEQYFIPNGQDGEKGDSALVEIIGVEGGHTVITYIDVDGDGKYTEGVDEKISEAFVPNGIDGSDGDDGADGKSSKVEVIAGVKDGKTGYWIVTYFDADGNGEFSESEIISREFVTDGKAASATVTPAEREGVNGNLIVTFYDENGDGVYTPGVDILVSEAFVPNPRGSKVVIEEGDGGNWIITFFDANGDGQFAASEEVDRQFVPNGADGTDGKDGLSTDVRVVKGQDELGNPGTWIYTYVDANGDGQFTEDERTGAEFVADGKGAPATTIKLEKGDGGTWVITYVDKNGDGEFAPDEEIAREFVADGKDGIDGETPVIGENGNWFIGGKDTGVLARGQNGQDGQTPIIGENGNWFIGGKDTGVKAGCDCAPGKDGKSITIVDQGLTEDGDVWVDFSDGTRIVIPSGKDAEVNVEEQGTNPPATANETSSANERCLPAALTVGAPLLALLPLGLIGQLDLPIARQFNAQLAAANTEIQKALGIFNGSEAQSASRLNGQMAQFGQIGGMVGGALIGIAVIGLITKFLIDNCKPVAEGEQPGAFALPEDFANSSN